MFKQEVTSARAISSKTSRPNTSVEKTLSQLERTLLFAFKLACVGEFLSFWLIFLRCVKIEAVIIRRTKTQDNTPSIYFSWMVNGKLKNLRACYFPLTAMNKVIEILDKTCVFSTQFWRTWPLAHSHTLPIILDDTLKCLFN